jgi:hypothetical protein
MARGPWRGIHTYVIYELFGIPSDRWLNCVPLQTTANYEEKVRIERFLCRRQDRPHRDAPPKREGSRRDPPDGGKGTIRKG